MANTKKETNEKESKKTTTVKKTTKSSTASKTSSASKNTKKSTSGTRSKSSSKSSTTKKVEPKKSTTSKTVSVEETKDTTPKSKENNIGRNVLIVILLAIFFGIIFYLSTLSGKGVYSDAPVDNGEVYDGVDVESESNSISEDEMTELNSIGIDEYINLKKATEQYSVIYIGRPTCSHCAVQLPIMKHLAYLYGIKINYLNTDSLSESEMSKLIKSDDFFNGTWGTPLTLIVKDDKLVETIEGESSIESLTEIFEQYEIISE